MKLAKTKRAHELVLIIILAFGFLASIPEARASPDIESCDSGETDKNYFELGEDVYLWGRGLEPDSWYHIYIFPDQDWTLGMEPNLLLHVKSASVQTDSDGDFWPQPVFLWTATELGSYDIWVNYADGVFPPIYDANDLLDDCDVGPAGFFVIPEVPLGTITVLLACFTAISLKHRKLF